MKHVSVWVGSACLSLAMAASLVAQVPALDVKMGLWEMSSTTEMSGQMPQMDTSKMTPEQKAQMEAAMKGMMGAHTNVTKSCMTREKFEKQSFMNSDRPGQNCKQTINTNTRTTLDSTITCSGEHTMTGQMHIEALSPTSVKAVFKSVNAARGGNMNVNLTMTGKWLGADCGDVK